MSNLNINAAADLVLRLTQPDDMFANAGFRDSGDVERFLSAWGAHVALLPHVQQPQCWLIALTASADQSVLPNAAAIRALCTAAASAQANSEFVEAALDATNIRRIPIPSPLRQLLQGGMWLHEHASGLSLENPTGRCFVLAAGRAVTVFVGGSTALRYTDAAEKTIESARELLQKQGWHDGELLERCGCDELPDRTRRGIWEDADLFVLKRAPEVLIQSILHDYLRLRLTGYVDMSKEAHVPNEGRVDLLIVLADGRKYLVEVKWIGRSLKQNVKLTKEVRALLAKRWRCDHVFTLDDKAAHSGTTQMSFYHKRLSPTRTYLVAFDCRWIEDQLPASAATRYPPAPDLAPNQYRVLHVPVDPRSASVKSK